MSKERIKPDAQFLALPRHHIDRIVQKCGANFGGCFGHKNRHPWLSPHQHRQRSDVILMGVRHQNSVKRPITDRFEIREGIVAFVFRVHAAIQNQAMIVYLKVVGVGTDFDASRQIREFHR